MKKIIAIALLFSMLNLEVFAQNTTAPPNIRLLVRNISGLIIKPKAFIVSFNVKEGLNPIGQKGTARMEPNAASIAPGETQMFTLKQSKYLKILLRRFNTSNKSLAICLKSMNQFIVEFKGNPNPQLMSHQINGVCFKYKNDSHMPSYALDLTHDNQHRNTLLWVAMVARYTMAAIVSGVALIL